MSFCDFKGIWKIREVKLFGSEIEGHLISIDRQAGDVLILCVDDPEHHIHPSCRYEEEGDRLLGPTFEITRTPGTPRILTCRSLHPINTGSWTAEDPGGLGGDGGGGGDE